MIVLLAHLSDTDHLCTPTLHATAPEQWDRLQTLFFPLQTKAQADCLDVYTKFIADPFKDAFPEEKTFCEPPALFSDGNAPTVAAKVLVIGHFATSRFFQETGARPAAVMRNLTDGSGRCLSDWAVRQFIYTNTKSH
jgi:hypothetical protein